MKDYSALEEAPIEEIVVTDSIPLGKEEKPSKIIVKSVAPLLAEAIRRVHNEESVANLFGIRMP